MTPVHEAHEVARAMKQGTNYYPLWVEVLFLIGSTIIMACAHLVDGDDDADECREHYHHFYSGSGPGEAIPGPFHCLQATYYVLHTSLCFFSSLCIFASLGIDTNCVAGVDKHRYLHRRAGF